MSNNRFQKVEQEIKMLSTFYRIYQKQRNYTKTDELRAKKCSTLDEVIFKEYNNSLNPEEINTLLLLIETRYSLAQSNKEYELLKKLQDLTNNYLLLIK